jgi:hypothetical protein
VLTGPPAELSNGLARTKSEPDLRAGRTTAYLFHRSGCAAANGNSVELRANFTFGCRSRRNRNVTESRQFERLIHG